MNFLFFTALRNPNMREVKIHFFSEVRNDGVFIRHVSCLGRGVQDPNFHMHNFCNKELYIPAVPATNYPARVRNDIKIRS